MRIAERHADLDEQRQAEQWAEYLAWFESERQLSELEEKQDAKDSTSVH